MDGALEDAIAAVECSPPSYTTVSGFKDTLYVMRDTIVGLLETHRCLFSSEEVHESY